MMPVKLEGSDLKTEWSTEWSTATLQRYVESIRSNGYIAVG
jgi:hypothetical protein